MHATDQPEQTELTRIVDLFRRRALVIVACIALGAGLAYLYASSQDKEYESSASVLLRAPSIEGGDVGAASLSSPAADPIRESATTLELAGLDAVQQRTAAVLRARGDAAAAEAAGSVDVSSEGQSDLVTMKATAGDPQTAARTANAFAGSFVAFQRDAARRRIRDARGLLTREARRLESRRADLEPGTRRSARLERLLSSRIRDIEGRIEDLDISRSLQTGDAQIVQEATPPGAPSAPKPARTAIIGGLAGLLLGLGIALARDQLDRRLRTTKDLEGAFGAPVLARVPPSADLHHNRMPQELLAPEAEAFRMLRANIRYVTNGNGPLRSVLLTSPGVGAGKTTVAFNLAAASAASGLKVLLIEADIRRSGLAKVLNLPPGDGLSSLLSGHVDRLEDVITELPVAAHQNGTRTLHTMDVILAGPSPANPSELLESDRMQWCVRAAEQAYDLVIVDAAPPTIVADSIPLMNTVSGVLIVGRLGQVTGAEARRLRQQIEGVHAHAIGVVANCSGPEEAGYYGYGYGYANDGNGRG